jgi:hypothetical protein
MNDLPFSGMFYGVLRRKLHESFETLILEV